MPFMFNLLCQRRWLYRNLSHTSSVLSSVNECITFGEIQQLHTYYQFQDVHIRHSLYMASTSFVEWSSVRLKSQAHTLWTVIASISRYILHTNEAINQSINKSLFYHQGSWSWGPRSKLPWMGLRTAVSRNVQNGSVRPPSLLKHSACNSVIPYFLYRNSYETSAKLIFLFASLLVSISFAHNLDCGSYRKARHSRETSLAKQPYWKPC